MRKLLAAVSAMTALGAGGAMANPACGAETHRRFGETRAYFQDVLAACRPDGYCSLVGEIAEPSRSAAYRQQFRVARPTPGAPYAVQFVGVTPMPLTPTGPMSLIFAARAFDLTPAVATTDSVNEYRVTSDETAGAIVAEMKSARSMRWIYEGEHGPASAVFPLNGLSAALEWIDCMGAER